jgi:predicted nucleic acid-binding protein
MPVLLETANALARPAWRRLCVNLFESIEKTGVEIIPLNDDLWRRGWELYCKRMDKAWSLTDCVSFVVMTDRGLMDALTTDDDFRQAGFRAVLQDSP